MINRPDGVFHSVTVDHVVRGGTRVVWDLDYRFTDPQPWDFTLQIGRTATPDGDWIDVGIAVRNGWYAMDDRRREGGITLNAHYRIKLVTAQGTYFSAPVPEYGILQVRDWYIASEIIREFRLRASLISVPGWLVKRRRAGVDAASAPPRNAQIDVLTGLPLRSKGENAVPAMGTEFIGGYYAPVPFDVDAANQSVFYDETIPQGPGTVNPQGEATASGLSVLVPPVVNRDIFVAKGSDLRFEVDKVTVTAAHRGIPLLGNLELHLIPFDHLIYTIAMPE